MKSHWIAAASLAALLMPAASEAAAHSSKLAPPPELIASLDRGLPSGLDGVRAFANAVQPGLGMMINDAVIDSGLAKVAGLDSLDAFDHQRSMYLLFVDNGGQSGVALVGRIADRKKLAPTGKLKVVTRRGWALVGAAQVVQKLSRWALAALPAQAPTSTPSVTVYVAHAVTRYRTQIEQFEAQMKVQLAAKPETALLGQQMLDGFAALVGDADRLRLAIDSDQAHGGIEIALSALPRTRLEQFFRAQRPSDYALLDKLPSTAATVVLAGHLEGGPYHQAFLDLMTRIFSGGGVPPELARYADAFTRFATGETAAAMRFSPKGASMTYLYGVADRAAAETALAQLLASYAGGRTFELFGMKQTSKTVPGALVHDGVSVRGYDQTYDPKSIPAATRATMAKMMGKNPTTRTELAVFDQLGLIATGPNAAARAASTIDAARGKGSRYTPPEEISQILAASRARKESVAMVMNLGDLAGQVTPGAKVSGTLASTLGFADGSAHLRFSLSATAVRSLLPRKSAPSR